MGSQLLEFETSFHEAAIKVDATLTFKWLASYNLDVCCKTYGLQTKSKHRYFIPEVSDCTPRDVKFVQNVFVDHQNFHIRQHPGEATNHPYQMVTGEYLQAFERDLPLEDFMASQELPELNSIGECDPDWAVGKERVSEVHPVQNFDFLSINQNPEKMDNFVQGVFIAEDQVEDPKVTATRNKIFQDFESTVFREKLGNRPPKRGPLGEAVIEMKPGKLRAKHRAFPLVGKHQEAMNSIITSLFDESKIERGMSAWCSPAFPVARKAKGSCRLVVHYRLLNDATVPDAHSLPKSDEILIRQGGNNIWTVLA